MGHGKCWPTLQKTICWDNPKSFTGIVQLATWPPLVPWTCPPLLPFESFDCTVLVPGFTQAISTRHREAYAGSNQNLLVRERPLPNFHLRGIGISQTIRIYQAGSLGQSQSLTSLLPSAGQSQRLTEQLPSAAAKMPGGRHIIKAFCLCIQSQHIIKAFRMCGPSAITYKHHPSTISRKLDVLDPSLLVIHGGV